MPTPRKLAAIRFTVYGAIAFFFGWLALMCYLHMQWSYAMPKQPDAVSGRVYRLVVNHGWVIFVTSGEARFFSIAEHYVGFGAMAAFFVAAGLNQKYRVLRG
jgi:hypothetical protein